MDCPVTARPTVIVISDSLGDTACEVVLAASGQFDEGAFCVLRLPKVTSVEQVKSFVGPRVDADHRDIAVFHTIVDPALRARVLDYLGMLHIRLGRPDRPDARRAVVAHRCTAQGRRGRDSQDR